MRLWRRTLLQSQCWCKTHPYVLWKVGIRRELSSFFHQPDELCQNRTPQDGDSILPAYRWHPPNWKSILTHDGPFEPWILYLPCMDVGAKLPKSLRLTLDGYCPSSFLGPSRSLTISDWFVNIIVLLLQQHTPYVTIICIPMSRVYCLSFLCKTPYRRWICFPVKWSKRSVLLRLATRDPVLTTCAVLPSIRTRRGQNSGQASEKKTQTNEWL